MSLFPMIAPQIADTKGSRGLYTEVAWDFAKSVPVYRNGRPVMVTGAAAVLVWAWHALKTARYVYEIFTWDYGNEMSSLIGKSFTDELKQHETPRVIREALLINPYITEVNDIQTETEGDALKISCRIMTVYGEVKLNV